jgi:hypothetical protein
MTLLAHRFDRPLAIEIDDKQWREATRHRAPAMPVPLTDPLAGRDGISRATTWLAPGPARKLQQGHPHICTRVRGRLGSSQPLSRLRGGDAKFERNGAS